MPPSGLRSRNFAIGEFFAERLEQLDLGVRQGDEHRGHAMLGQRHGGGYLGAERIAIEGSRLGDIAHGDRDVIEPSDHECLRSSPSASRTPRMSARSRLR